MAPPPHADSQVVLELSSSHIHFLTIHMAPPSFKNVAATSDHHRSKKEMGAPSTVHMVDWGSQMTPTAEFRTIYSETSFCGLNRVLEESSSTFLDCLPSERSQGSQTSADQNTGHTKIRPSMGLTRRLTVHGTLNKSFEQIAPLDQQISHIWIG